MSRKERSQGSMGNGVMASRTEAVSRMGHPKPPEDYSHRAPLRLDCFRGVLIQESSPFKEFDYWPW